MHDIRYNAVHDEIVVGNPFAEAVLTFSGNSKGEAAPLRIIQGPSTLLDHGVDRLDVDPAHNEIVVPAGNKILVFPREGNGDVPPARIIRGPDVPLIDAKAVAIDPVRNLIVVGDDQEKDMGAALFIYNRTDNGNVKPRAAIRGPRTGLESIEQFQVYPPGGWIIVAMSAGPWVGIWSIHDNGDVPPRWKLRGPKSKMTRPRGVALIPKNKEIVIADMLSNSVLTFYFPEVF